MSPRPASPGAAAHEVARRYEARAEAVARGVAQEWLTGEPDDLRILADAAYARLVEEANLELRQALTRAQGQLEMALRAVPTEDERFPRGRTDAVQEAIARATAICDTWLDRGMATRALVHVERRRFDLALECRGRFDPDVILLGDAQVPVDGDPLRLVEALARLARGLRARSPPREPIVVRLSRCPDAAVGFVGVRSRVVAHDALVEELTAPVTSARLDVAYARAVVERHGGELRVEAHGDLRGFGFRVRDEPGDAGAAP